MKRFITKALFLVLIPIIFYFGIVEFLVRSIPNDYAFKNELLEKKGAQIEVVIFGSSNAFYSFQPREIDKYAVSLANVSQTPLIEEFMLDKAYKMCPNLKCVVLPITYPTFFYNMADVREFWRVTNYNIYFGSSFRSDELSYRFITYNTNFLIPLKRAYSYYIDGETELECDEFGYGDRLDVPYDENFCEYGKMYSESHTSMYNYEAFTENKKAYLNMVEFCVKNNIKVIIPYMPTHECYWSNLDPELLKKTREIMFEAKSKFENVEVIDLYKDERFLGHENFYDRNHLNKQGGRILSCIVSEKINKITN